MQFAILISVLVALLLGAFLLLTHAQSFFRIKSQELTQAFEEVNIQLFNSLANVSVSNDTLISSSGTKTSRQFSKYQGAWLQQYSEIEAHNRKAIKVAYTGAKLTDKTPNLYLVNTNSPLVVVGATRLEGNNYLPKQGVKAGNISGTYYQGSNLFYGRAIESNTSLPKLKHDWINYLEYISKGSLINDFEPISIEKEIENSFLKPSQILFSTAPIFLESEKITGNITIQSKTKIVIGAGSQLTHVTLIAPRIEIKNGVQGSFQCIATKNIEIGKRCYLSYPSSAILLDQNVYPENANNNQIQNAKPLLNIEADTVIEGAIVYVNKKNNTADRIKTHVQIAPKAEIVGEVYCQGNTDFQGIIRGSLYTQQCIARQSGSVYLNHIYNGKVLINPVKDYAGLPFENSKNSIAKWLY